MYKNILLILFFGIIISQDLFSIPEIIEKGLVNKSYVVSLTIRLGKNASISQSSEKAFNEAAQAVLRRKNRIQLESSTILQSQNNGKFFNKIISIEIEGEISDSKTFPSIIRIDDKGEIYIDYKFEFWINKNKKSKKDPWFNIDASFTDIKEYYDGDEMYLNFESDSNCFMYLYNYLPHENKVKVLYRIEPSDGFYGKEYLNKEKFKPLKLIAQFDDRCSSETYSFEHLILVAIKKERDILLGKKEVMYEDFQKALKKLPREGYETKMISYVIHEK